MLTIIRIAIQKSGHIFKKSPLHGVHYSAKEGTEEIETAEIVEK
jgi:hypothetical protein